MPQLAPAPRRAVPAALVAAALAVPALAVLPALPASASPAAAVVPPAAGAPAALQGMRPAAVAPVPGILRRGDVPPGGSPSTPRLTRGSLTVVPGVAAPPVSTWRVTYTGFDAHPDAKLAFQRAVDIWAGIVRSAVPITVKASFADLGDPNLLGQTGPGDFYVRGTGADTTLYPSALADAVTGADQAALAGSAGTPDIDSTFNSNAGGVYYGTDGNPGVGQVDFETIVLHELGHGLGFLGTMDVDSAGLGSFYVPPTPFDRLTFGPAGPLVDQRGWPGNNTTGLAATLQGNAVTWGGAGGTANNGGRHPQLYAPAPWQPGSSISHLDEATYPQGTVNSLMTPLLDEREVVRTPGPVTLGILGDSGWSVAYPTGGAIGQRYLALGGPGGGLGWALGPEYDVPGGRAQNFAGGRVYWSVATGAHEVHGAVLGRYLAAGGARGGLGLPTNDEIAVPGGAAGTFTGGHIYWSARSGAKLVRGAVLGRYLSQKGAFGRLGLPLDEEQPQAGGARQRFGAGNIYWSARTDAQVVEGAILGAYVRLGEAAGVLGMPLAGEEGVVGGRLSRFAAGHVYWGPQTGAHSVQGAILGRYLALRGPASALGLPVSDEYGVAGGRRSDFRTAGLVWIAASNTVVQVPR